MNVLQQLVSPNEIHSLAKDGQDVAVDADISLDGTWQKKDHSSKNGAVTAIFSPKVNFKIIMSCQNHVRVVKHGQNEKMMQTATNGKIATTVISISQNCQVPWKIQSQWRNHRNV